MGWEGALLRQGCPASAAIFCRDCYSPPCGLRGWVGKRLNPLQRQQAFGHVVARRPCRGPPTGSRSATRVGQSAFHPLLRLSVSHVPFSIEKVLSWFRLGPQRYPVLVPGPPEASENRQ